ncbi:UDP-N-acetylmuramoyl-L-alanyl-D-glutamate--2,6-diaminopimelate ligase [Cellulomonas sp. PhB143]|uniref:UDP-N-acetylmuramoyl-L-alanyl-D-glutamate--2, 6-diaminopimelate ligase n=1 Tax=Cellulomonas sp. PhB143 TaxID=2485186 RepID=UPI000F497D0B|nr:UDP-N-acetylmuramoyl-L-alanyl-D-glutamate--2,6-diaminopimelate ligase [Cellulomonas sp. PhB143]ROS77208.1 UDP-N-acetylmuramoylalanyl-D-glutamate--2,6-diaminopimelate ligase [Cellulomonas sp. PhB143]
MSSPIARIRPVDNPGRSVRDLASQFELDLRGTAGDRDVQVRSVVSDNRAVSGGDLFVALPGAHVHGARFASDAVARGAAALLTDEAGLASLTDPGVPVLVCEDPRALLGAIASAVYGAPSHHLTTFAVTGTNGKTTTTYLLDHALRSMGFRGGLIGTVEMRSGDRVLPSRLTTPEAADLQALLAAMREDDVRTLAMEVSSHALALHRVDGVVFDVAGFTNLSQDHLDFHGDLQGYFEAKAQLFTPERSRRGVVVVDDVWGERMARAATVPVATLRTRVAGGGQEPGEPADWVVADVVEETDGTAFTVRHRDGRELRTATRLPGGFNVSNAALALVMVLEAGTDPRDLAEGLAGADGMSPSVPGRMEVLSSAPRTVVDFAHNTEALAEALAALRPTTTGRLVVVFGATGERDTGKRPMMGAVAVEGADVVVVTDDDPHGEDPALVRREVLAGARAALAAADGSGAQVAGDLQEVAPRAVAIRRAVLEADAGDTVLVAGRGHEVWQEIAGVDHPLDDRVEVRTALAARDARGGAQDDGRETKEHEG